MATQQMRTKGTELSDFTVEGFMQEAKAQGYPINASAYKTLEDLYVADRSLRRLKRNMTWMLDFIRHISPNINTRSSRAYKMQKHLKTLYPEERHELITETMRLTKNEYVEKSVKSDASRTEALQQVFTITKEYITDLVDKLKREDSLESNILLIQLATGRRFADVIHAADIPKKKGASLVFNKLSKSDSTADRKVPLYFIKYKELVERWTKVRDELVEIITDDKSAAVVSDRVGNKARSITGSSHRTHFMRKLYVAWSLQFKPKRWNATVWINKVLAHDKGSLDTALNYSNVVLGDEVDLTKKEVIKEDSPALARLIETIKQMKKDGESLTHVNIKKHGFGGSTITRYLKTAKAALE